MAARWDGAHSTPVLCLDASGEGLVASGAEGGDLAVWAGEGVPLGQVRLPGAEDVSCVIFSPTRPATLFASHGRVVSELDARALGDPVRHFHVNAEEINCISLNETAGLLASADDSGAVEVVDLAGPRAAHRSLRGHANICSAVAFRPQRTQSLLSCGLDMQVMLWGLREGRPLWTASLQAREERGSRPAAAAAQLFNPPLVHSLSVAAGGDLFGCGAEDGSVRLFGVTGARARERLAFRAHGLGVSQVRFLAGTGLLLSGGNDGQVRLWDVGGAGGPRGAARRRRPGPPGPKLTIRHGEKVNWITSAHIRGSPKVLVADQSPVISVYPLSGL
ncbi:WD repeat-containing protein 53 [Tachyglossus aculeatus]|uniref:WD repeat-containing protein 53 n=1 Tax=Tachyglossus aculeatus TaxID=9261 RepID=UPI0018F5D029|nr:WD repeat-containing protein 53 [Tachyglossus aculeatus]XP_038596038.1 WD repeat-containing protein 53 [Tachyglossus aculeatus]XP_038596120.1 WD repeat-containing protein 53 [Tachyglossus aculeatus]